MNDRRHQQEMEQRRWRQRRAHQLNEVSTRPVSSPVQQDNPQTFGSGQATWAGGEYGGDTGKRLQYGEPDPVTGQVQQNLRGSGAKIEHDAGRDLLLSTELRGATLSFSISGPAKVPFHPGNFDAYVIYQLQGDEKNIVDWWFADQTPNEDPVKVAEGRLKERYKTAKELANTGTTPGANDLNEK